MKFLAFPSIENFHNIIKDFRRQNKIDRLKYEIGFVPKIKLHGTNAAIYVPSLDKRLSGRDTIRVAKRTGFIELGTDNAGFAAWVESNKVFIDNSISNHFDMIIWGEWAGPGVQKSVAISEISVKTFFVFALYFPEIDQFYWETATVRTMLEKISPILVILESLGEMNMKVVMDLCDVNSINIAIEKINTWVDQCDELDPWVKKHYNIEGTGEGFVFYPCFHDKETHCLHDISPFMFKAKGQKHSVNKQKKAVVLDAEKISHANEFSNKFVTEQRCNQALEHVELDIKKMGEFLKWIANDIIKESEDELESSGKNWKDVSKAVAMASSHWFKEKIKSSL